MNVRCHQLKNQFFGCILTNHEILIEKLKPNRKYEQKVKKIVIFFFHHLLPRTNGHVYDNRDENIAD